MLVTRALLAWRYRCDFFVSIIIMYLKAMFNLSYMWGRGWGMGYKGGGVTGGSTVGPFGIRYFAMEATSDI